MHTQDIVTEQQEHVVLARVHRPAKKNALTRAMYAALTALLAEAGRDPATHVVVVTGSEDSFSSGNDIADFLAAPPTDEESPVFQFLMALQRFEKPLIAAVNGMAVGIGVTLLLHCDLVYARAGAVLRMPFVNLGLCPEAGSSWLLPRRIGHARAAELLLLGDAFNAERALEWGLINGIGADAEATLELALAQARRLAALPARAVRLTKALLKQPDAERVKDSIALESRYFIELLGSPEARAALLTFAQRR
ncbi:MAG: enoyl-CoA hydratase/isomerase family protein [Candidatus Competibacteraceae bacterium]|nr:enoyl-CoA hydratase/isomerase family protein [Candidatus Competibacteraceae bacterium]MBK9950900.1 enoyl-CoA hydratase/isomerase family protein [Candidatus Competibacteraceae bacterium]